MSENALEERLIEIRDRIDVMIHLLLAPIQITEPKVRGKVQQKVLTLCDFTHTREEIADELQISLNQVDVTLNNLRKKNLIRSVQVGGKTYYVRIR